MTQTITSKEVTVLARATHKNNAKVVLYKVLSSDESTKYDVTIYEGKCTSCKCKGWKGHRHCYHGDECEKLEAARQYDVVGAALQVVKQAEVDAQVGDFYETVTREELETRRAYHDLATGYDSIPGMY